MKDELKVGDKVRIICEDGHSSNARFTHNGNPICGVTKAEITINHNELVEVKLNVISTLIDCEAVVSEISKNQHDIEKVKKIIEGLPEPGQWQKGKRDYAYEAIFDIRDIIAKRTGNE